MLSETFWVSFITIGSGLIASAIAVCYKSKCSEISFCGLSIKRDVRVELLEDMKKMEFTKSSSEIQNIRSPKSSDISEPNTP